MGAHSGAALATDSQHYQDLSALVRARRVVIVVGSGVSVAATRGMEQASWTGLLRLGAVRVAHSFPKLGQPWLERTLGEIESDDLHDVLAAASKIGIKLRESGMFGSWLRETIGVLRPLRPAVLRELCALKVPLLTTNYDSLLEQVSGHREVTWMRPDLIERVLRGDSSAIVHLHGYWEDPESVILDWASYQRLVDNVPAQALQRSFHSAKTFLFVGCGAGLDDPNLGGLREWMDLASSQSEYSHYQLVLAKELEARGTRGNRNERILPVAYGHEYGDLPGFLRQLRSGGAHRLPRGSERTTQRDSAPNSDPALPGTTAHSSAARDHDLLGPIVTDTAGSDPDPSTARWDQLPIVQEVDATIDELLPFTTAASSTLRWKPNLTTAAAHSSTTADTRAASPGVKRPAPGTGYTKAVFGLAGYGLISAVQSIKKLGDTLIEWFVAMFLGDDSFRNFTIAVAALTAGILAPLTVYLASTGRMKEEACRRTAAIFAVIGAIALVAGPILAWETHTRNQEIAGLEAQFAKYSQKLEQQQISPASSPKVTNAAVKALRAQVRDAQDQIETLKKEPHGTAAAWGFLALVLLGIENLVCAALLFIAGLPMPRL